GTTYYYQVGAWNTAGTAWSIDYSVTAGAPQPTTPSIPSGDNYTDCDSGTKNMTFSWGASSTTNVDYYVQVDDDPNFASLNYSSGWLTANQTTWGADMAQGTWYWRVGTKDRVTSLVTWSTTLSYILYYGGD